MIRILQSLEIKKVFLWISILIVISVFSSSNIFALDLTFDGPDEVYLNQEFEVNIQYSSNETNDVKIVIQSLSDKKSLSEVFYENKWTSSFYFVSGAYPDTKTFKVRVKTFSSSAEICVKVRRSSDKNGQKELCKPITITENSNNDNNNSDENNSSNENNNDNNSSSNSSSSDTDQSDDKEKSDNSNDKSVKNTVTYNPISQNTSKESSSPKKIILGNDEQVTPKQVLITKEEKIRQGVVYAFAALCVVLIILLSFNKL